MVSTLALNAAKLASRHLAFSSPYSGMTEATQAMGLANGLANERSSEPQGPTLSEVDIRERQRGGQQNREDTRQRSVLIIDDNDDNLLFAQYAVEHLGYRTTAIKSGHGAVATAMTCLPDIILLDILLKHINGIDVFHQLRQHETLAHVPIVAVTALARPCDRANIMAAGFSDYLLKPYMIADLQRMLSRHLPA